MQCAQILLLTSWSSYVKLSSAFSVSKSFITKKTWSCYDDYLSKSASFLMLWNCLLWEDDSSHPITHCDGFIFLDQWLWSLLEQHCTMTLHFKDQIRWLVTCRKKSQNFMHVRTGFNQSLSVAVLLNWKKLQSLQHRESCLMETSNCRDYWSRNTIVSKGLPFSKSNITIWNQTCVLIDRPSDFWSLKIQWETWTLIRTQCTSVWQGILLQRTGFYLPVWIRVTKECGI